MLLCISCSLSQKFRRNVLRARTLRNPRISSLEKWHLENKKTSSAFPVNLPSNQLHSVGMGAFSQVLLPIIPGKSHISQATAGCELHPFSFCRHRRASVLQGIPEGHDLLGTLFEILWGFLCVWWCGVILSGKNHDLKISLQSLFIHPSYIADPSVCLHECYRL